MNKLTKLLLYGFMTFTLIALLSGCQKKVFDVQISSPSPSVRLVDDYLVANPPSALPAANQEANNKNNKPIISSGHEQAADSAPDQTPSVDNGKQDNPATVEQDNPPVVKPEVPKITNPYKQGAPTLMGLSLLEMDTSVVKKYGEPKNQYIMDDDSDPITVYEYAAFSVGFNKSGQLQFVEVTSADIDPGLNGLRLNQKVSDAVNALGEPDLNTAYVLSYQSAGVILKLDVNPKDNTVNSIKLFAN